MSKIAEPEVVYCKYNHIYDKSLSAECPYCKQIAERTTQFKNQMDSSKKPAKKWGFGRQNADSDDDATTLLSRGWAALTGKNNAPSHSAAQQEDDEDDATELVSRARRGGSDRTELRRDDDDATVLRRDDDATVLRRDDDDATVLRRDDDPTQLLNWNTGAAAAYQDDILPVQKKLRIILPGYYIEEDEVPESKPAEPENTEPEVIEPEGPEIVDILYTRPEDEKPDLTGPEAFEPEVTKPEVTEPEVAAPVLILPEKAKPEGKAPEAAVSVSAAPAKPRRKVIGWLVCASSEVDYGISLELKEGRNLISFDESGHLLVLEEDAAEDSAEVVIYRDSITGIFQIRPNRASVQVNDRTVSSGTYLEPYSRIMLSHAGVVFFPAVGVCGFEWRQ